MTTNTAVAAKAGNLSDDDYHQFVDRFRARAHARIQKNVLFTTDADNLWEIYLDSFPEDQRQHHNCHACRRFIQAYGNIVAIGEDGVVHPLLWEEGDADSPSSSVAILNLCRAVQKAKVTGVFLSSEPVWGQHITGIWRHMSVENPKVFSHPLYKAHQVAAEKATEYATVSKCLSEFTIDQLEEAVRILQADALDRTEKVLGQALWLRDLKKMQASAVGMNRKNLLWRAVATAPSGFCHPRASMISTLLDDLAAGLPFETVSERWTKKMHPLRYQRPTAPPKDGAIQQAEEVVGKLGTAGSLARRFATLQELPVRLWTPAPAGAGPKPGGSVFGHLRAATPSPSVTLPEQRLTWEKFAATVLPTTDRIEFHVPLRSQLYVVFTTAVNDDAPPILQWDAPERRNPFAWYVWHGGSPPHQFGLLRDSWVDVLALTEKPPHFYDTTAFTHHSRGLVLILNGAEDTQNSGSGIFPECLLSEYHGIRSVIEAHSRKDVVQPASGQKAQGLLLDKGNGWNALLRVTTKGKSALYRLDRWD